MATAVTNQDIAATLERIAALLEAQDANPHRVRAYRSGADTVRQLNQPVSDLLADGGTSKLRELPGIGAGLARAIREVAETGRSGVLERLEGEVSGEKLFSSVPGIGPELGRRVAEKLDISTLEELEMAAHDGRLAQIEGFGERRVEGVRDSLAGMLSQSARRRSRRLERGGKKATYQPARPPVGLLLEVDHEYRQRAAAGELKRIAPRRFNPDNKAWLPIMHTERGDWEITALYSNTARAHELGATGDWVVIYYDHGEREDQCTVITAARGPVAGRRVVRGREQECRQHYGAQA